MTAPTNVVSLSSYAPGDGSVQTDEINMAISVAESTNATLVLDGGSTGQGIYQVDGTLTISKPITIVGVSRLHGLPTPSGFGPTFTATSANFPIFTLTNVDGVELSEFIIKLTSPGAAAAIQATGCSNLNFSSIEINGAGSGVELINCLMLARFRGHFPLRGEGSIHGQATPISAGVPA